MFFFFNEKSANMFLFTRTDELRNMYAKLRKIFIYLFIYLFIIIV